MSEQTPENPFVVPTEPTFSPVDTILKLDEFLSSDVRLAEKTARFATRPDLEADIENLEAELAALVDDYGRPLTPPGEQAIGEEQGRTAALVAAEIEALQVEYAASFVSIRLRQLNGDDWPAFKVTWRDAIEGEDSSKRDAMFDDLVVRCAIAPKMTAAQWTQVRGKIGGHATEMVRSVAWAVNSSTGVSVPKSSLSSAVLRQLKLEQN